MRAKGAKTMGQDENHLLYMEPKVAFNIGAVEKQSSLENISNTIFYN